MEMNYNFDLVIDHREEEENKNVINESVEHFTALIKGEIRRARRVKEIFKKEDKDKKENNSDEVIESKYWELTCEDEDLNRFVIKDKNIQIDYKNGVRGTFKVQIYIEHKFKGKTKINLIEFMPGED